MKHQLIPDSLNQGICKDTVYFKLKEKSNIEGELNSYSDDFIVKDRLSFKLFESKYIYRNILLSFIRRQVLERNKTIECNKALEKNNRTPVWINVYLQKPFTLS